MFIAKRIAALLGLCFALAFSTPAQADGWYWDGYGWRYYYSPAPRYQYYYPSRYYYYRPHYRHHHHRWHHRHHDRHDRYDRDRRGHRR